MQILILFRFLFQYVLNVTPDLPNTFEADGCGINYLKIPIADHWSQNLAVHFPQAIRFIGKLSANNTICENHNIHILEGD